MTNGRWENTEFNSRLQPTKIGLGSGVASQSLLKLEYSYGSTANNGNVIEQKITVPGVAHPFIQAYTYDELNRLATAEETKNSSQEWKQTFVYDRYGNRNFNTSGSNTTTLPSGFDPDIYNPTISATNNRFSSGQGYSYDASGNTTRDAENRKFTYDAENKQVKVETVDGSGNPTATIGEYFYDGDGKRTKKYVPGTGETTIFVYDATGKQIAEYSTIVQTESNAKITYATNDHLGSPRINTDGIGTVISRHDYHPFGEEVTRTGYGSDTIRRQFTGYERDNETDLDFAQARYYAKTHGRFNSPDPIFIKKDRLLDPQRLNLYVYVRNSPFKFVDTSGQDLILANATARQQVNGILDKLVLTGAERANIRVDGNKVVLVDASAVDVGKASAGYNLLYKYIAPGAKHNANYYGIAPNQTVTVGSKTFTYDQVQNSGDITFLDSQRTPQNSDIIVATGGGPEVLANNGDYVPFPEYLVFGHGLYHGVCGQGMCAVQGENELRREQRLSLRDTQTGHEILNPDGTLTGTGTTKQTVGVTAPMEPITTTPTVISTQITPRQPIPLPIPPKKPGEN